MEERDKLWTVLEAEIQRRAPAKDKAFVLEGAWKRLVREQDGFRVFSVDGGWIRDNLCVYFSHGGHGLVHSFIPMDEVWIGRRHRKDALGCACRTHEPDQPVSQAFFDSTVIHEIFEFKRMQEGMEYAEAHRLALEEERRAGLLEDPYADL